MINDVKLITHTLYILKSLIANRPHHESVNANWRRENIEHPTYSHINTAQSDLRAENGLPASHHTRQNTNAITAGRTRKPEARSVALARGDGMQHATKLNPNYRNICCDALSHTHSHI